MKKSSMLITADANGKIIFTRISEGENKKAKFDV